MRACLRGRKVELRGSVTRQWLSRISRVFAHGLLRAAALFAPMTTSSLSFATQKSVTVSHSTWRTRTWASRSRRSIFESRLAVLESARVRVRAAPAAKSRARRQTRRQQVAKACAQVRTQLGTPCTVRPVGHRGPVEKTQMIQMIQRWSERSINGYLRTSPAC